MKILNFLFLLHLSISMTIVSAQINPFNEYPQVFHDVQMGKYFKNSRTFANYAPLIPPEKIDSCYRVEKEMQSFRLDDFIKTYFVSENPRLTISPDTSYSLEGYCKSVWKQLRKESEQSKNSYIELPKPYIIASENMPEMHYNESFYIFLGLLETGNKEIIKDLFTNFSFLINKYGLIPESNRSYHLSRSSMPYLSVMIESSSSILGDSVYIDFLDLLEKEYDFWMSGENQLSNNKNSYKRVVRLPDGTILNRYWDDINYPRPEAYSEDIKFAQQSPLPDSIDFRNIRAANESTWFKSSRWLKNNNNYSELQTIDILPVDLNCLIYHLEVTLAGTYKKIGNKIKHKELKERSKQRALAIDKYFWNDNVGFYSDYNYISAIQTPPDYISGIYPLFVNASSKKQARRVSEYVDLQFLKEWGITASTKESGLIFDYPNSFSAYNYICAKGLSNYKFNEQSIQIRVNWINTNLLQLKKWGSLSNQYCPDKHSSGYSKDTHEGCNCGIILHFQNSNR